MSRKVILLSKDAFGKYYLPTYGNTYWKTPNIDALASNGTVFMRHYTAAPSSAMSYYSMFTGQYAHESKIRNYRPLSPAEKFKGETLFDKAEKLGFECHIVWDTAWSNTAIKHSECYGNAIFHPLDNIRRPCGVHTVRNEKVTYDRSLIDSTFEVIKKCINEISANDRDIFVWMHLPHVWNGATGYGSDIDIYDECVGFLRSVFHDDIYITADHGNMNGSHGKCGYGFDVYEEASSIPLITPRIDNATEIDYPTSNVDLYSLIFENKIVKREVVYSDSAYYAQLHRKLAIIHGRYKYIFNCKGKKEELYDVVWDPKEQQNLMTDRMLDVDRGAYFTTSELYFYPYWSNLEAERKFMREELEKVWKNPSRSELLYAYYEKTGKTIKRKMKQFKLRHSNKNSDSI